MVISTEFEQIVARFPENIAVTQGNEKLTYCTLSERVTALSRVLYLQDQHGQAGNQHVMTHPPVMANQFVITLMEEGISLITAALAIMKAGKVFVPLSPKLPEQRLATLLAQFRGATIVTCRQWLPLLEHLSEDYSLVLADEVQDHPLITSSLMPAWVEKVHNLAYVYFTSGSTGKPKAILGREDSLLHFIRWESRELSVTPADKVSQLINQMFDPFLRDMLLPLLNGATLCIPSSLDIRYSPQELLGWISEQKISITHLIPSLFQVLLECPQSTDSLRFLRYAVLSGEPLKGSLVDLFYQSQLSSPQRQTPQIINLYGTTETTLASVFYRVTEKDLRQPLIPAGQPIDDTTILVVDEQGVSVPAGSEGEVWISTDYMSAGYLSSNVGSSNVGSSNVGSSEAENNSRFMIAKEGELAGRSVYRTGDLGRIDEQGNLILLGRNDFQIKINGQRLETAEIESLLEQHPAVQQAIVKAFEQSPEQLSEQLAESPNKQSHQQTKHVRLVAFVRLIPETTLTAAELDHYLAPNLTAAMRPADYQFLPLFPLLSNGKIDRKALQPPVVRQTYPNRSDVAAPQGELETRLAAIWQSLLQIEQVGRDDSFFALGGDSLQAIRMIAQVRQQMGLSLRFSELFRQPTLAQCVEMMSADKLSLTQEPDIAAGSDSASYEQQGIYLNQQTAPDSPMYNMVYVAQWSGALDHQRLQQSLDALFARYDVLRTGFLMQQGEIIARVAEYPPDNPVFARIIWQDLIQHGAQAQLHAENIINRFASLPFELTQPPLLRMAGLTLRPDSHQIILTFHHLIVDEESVKRLWDELLENYSLLQRGKALNIQPAQYGQREHVRLQYQRVNGERGMAARQYWQNQLAGTLPLLQLPYDFPVPAARSYQGKRVPFSLPTAFLQQLESVAHQYGITPYLILQAGFIAFLARYSRQNDILLGTPVSNRHYSEQQQPIGLLLNLLVMRNQVDISQPFEQLLEQVKSTFIDAIAHQDMPFSQLLPLLQGSRDSTEDNHHPGVSPLFQVLFTYQNIPVVSKRMGSVQLSPLRQWDVQIAKYELALEMWQEEGELQGIFQYAGDRFLSGTIERMAENLCYFLSQLIHQPQQTIGKIPLLSPAQQQQLAEWNQTEQPFSDNIGIHQLIERQVQRVPDVIAVEFGQQSLTYAELDQRANQMADFLIQQGVGPEICVGLSVERSAELVICFLAILKAGGVYVPIDPDYPLERSRYVIEDVGLHLLVTQEKFISRYQGYNLPLFSIETLIPRLSTFSAANPRVDVRPENTAYIIYTSGSTGKPKGVPVRHRSVCNLAETEIEFLAVPPGSRILQFASFSFDTSIWEILMAFCSGTTLLMAPRLAVMPGPDLLEQLIMRRVTHITLPASALAALPEADLPDLQVLMVAGENCGLDLLHKWGKNRRFINSYGPTEATVGTTNAELTPESEQIHIGRPIPNSQVWIMDEYGSLLPIGVAGELCIGGVGVVAGYLHHPELTERSFIADPFSSRPDARLYRTGDLARYRADGNIDYLGRIDQQIKIRGYRVELGEIESALRQHPAIADAVAMVREDYLNASAIVAYILTQPNTPLEPSQIEVYLEGSLPEFMRPSRYVFLTEFPRLPNNKVDRKRFPKPVLSKIRQESEIATEPAHNQTEQAIIQIWQSLLGYEAIGRNTSFFAAGGHSLLAARMVAMLAEQCGLYIKVSDVFICRTPKRLAEKVNLTAGINLLSLPEIQDAPLSFAQQRMWFLDQLYPDSSRYHIVSIKTFPVLKTVAGDEAENQKNKSEENERIRRSITLLFSRHPSLNLRLRMEGTTPRQYYSEQPPDCPHEIVEVQNKQEWQQMLQQRATDMMRTPFQLIGHPLYRLLLVSDARQGSALILCLHHILVDEQSLALLDDELQSIYLSLTKNQSVTEDIPQASAPDYLQFATWERSAEVQQMWHSQLDYWRQVYQQRPPVVTLPQQSYAPVEASKAAYYRLPLTIEQTVALRRLAQQQDTTLFTLLLAAFQVLLQRYSGEGEATGDIVIGIPVSLRDRPELQSVIGLLLNTLAVRQPIDIRQSFSEFLHSSVQTLNQAMANKDIPFEQVVDAILPAEKRSLSPLFQIMFVFNAHQYSASTPRINSQSVENPEAKFDLTLFVQETADNLLLSVEYREACFTAEVVAQFVSHYTRLLDSLCSTPDSPIYQLAMLSPQERQRQLSDLNTTAQPLFYPVVHQWFEQQVNRTPQAIAVREQNETGEQNKTELALSYEQLNHYANRLAHELLTQGAGQGIQIGICLPRSAMLVIAILAVMKTGAAYVPVDATYPAERARFMLEDAQVTKVITTHEQAVRLTLPTHQSLLLARSQFITDQAVDPDIVNPDTVNPDIAISPEQPAYILYTSGSTGRPKGTLIPHRGLGNYLQHACKHYGTSGRQGNTLHASISFDATLTSLFLPLLQGQTLFILPEGDDIPALIQAWQLLPDLTMAKITPAHLELLSQQLSPEQAGRIPLLVIGGESLSASALRFWRQHAPQVRIINEYGPTEATVGCCTYEIQAGEITGDGALPIGRPIANTRLYLLDECQQLVPFGSVGELYIGGAGVGSGYFNQPALTESRFIADPLISVSGEAASEEKLYRTGDLARYLPDGNLLFLGRKDQQIKLHGYRIELEEIEAQLSACQGVSQAAAGMRDIHGRQHLVAWLVLEKSVAEATNSISEKNAESIRQELLQRLPVYMCPTQWVVQETLPLTANGKIDRNALALLTLTEQPRHSMHRMPVTTLEKQLTEIWQQVLDQENPGIDDDFFVLGGDSILSLQIVFRVRELGFRITPKMLFDYPTIAGLAAVVTAVNKAENSDTASIQGKYTLLPIQQAFFAQHHANPHHYNQSYLYALEEGTDIPLLERALAQVVNQHDGLRSRFPLNKQKNEQRYGLITEPVTEWQIESCLITERPVKEALSQAFAERQAQLNIEHGPLLTATHFITSVGNYLLLTVHHLIVDGVSWRIIIEDLSRFYQALLAGKTLPPMAKTASLIEWSSHLADYAQSALAQAEYRFWQQKLNQPVTPLPVDRGGKSLPGLVRESATYRLTLDAVVTTNLVQNTGHAYRTHVGDLLLAALVATLQQWSGNKSVCVDMEGHGRDSLHEDVDVSRTVGWFTAIYPLLLELPASCSSERLIRLVKEAVRQVPYSGTGYGALRCSPATNSSTVNNPTINSPATDSHQLPDTPQADICFNYLGQFSRTFHQTPFSGVADIAPEQRYAADNARSHGLAVDCYIDKGQIDKGQLQIEWTYNCQCYRHETIERLAAAMKDRLIRLIEHCAAQTQTTYTPSDFPLARLNAETLHQLQQRYRVIEDIYPLTYTQEGMLFHSMAEQGRGLYHEQLCFTLPPYSQPDGTDPEGGEGINIEHLQQAWQKAVAYYPILRSRFEMRLADEPLQIVMPHQELDWRLHDLRLYSASDAELYRQNLLAADMAEEFIPEDGAMFRITVLQMPNKQLQLLFSHHHAILDGWSVRLLLTTVETFYFQPNNILPPAPAFRSFIRWQRQNRKACQDYWQDQLAKVSSATPLPAAHPLRATSQLKQRHTFSLSPDLSAQLAESGRRHRLTISTLIQGAWALLLQRYSPQNKYQPENSCLFGMTVSGRQAELAGIDKMAGLLISTLPTYITSNPEQTVADWLMAIQQQQREHEKFSDISLADLKSVCGLPEFETLLVFENYPQPKPTDKQEKLFEFVQAAESTNYPLVLVSSFSDCLRNELVYDTGLYDVATVSRLAKHFTHILTQIIDNLTDGLKGRVSANRVLANRVLANIVLLDEQEKQQLLTQWQGPVIPVFRGNVYSLFTRQVQRSPRQTAVIDGQQQVSYAELEQNVEQLCLRLHLNGTKAGDRVALYLPRSLDYITAMLAVSRIGACYVPVDISYPSERVAYLLSDSQSSLVLTDQAQQTQLAGVMPDITVLVVDQSQPPERLLSQPLPPLTDDADALAYLIYTSGSTGTPKGVMIEHQSLINYLTDAGQRYQVTAYTQSLFHSSVSFDATLTSLYLPLLHGGTITVIRDDADIAAMAAVLMQKSDTQKPVSHLLKITPAHLGILGEYLEPKAKPHVHSLVVGGDTLNAEIVQAWLSDVPDIGVFNEYGPTETVVGCCVHRADKRQDLQGAMPIGLPIANTRLFVLNDDFSPTPLGMAGELYIGGLGVARGYWNRPELTAEKFITLSVPQSQTVPQSQENLRVYRTGDRVCALPDGKLLYLGRVDRQIKLRGYRIEPGEIEARLMQHPSVQNSALVTYAEQGDMLLVACVSLKSAVKADILSKASFSQASFAEQIIGFLSRSLPAHMLPNKVVVVDEMPQTTNGKIDYRTLLTRLPDYFSGQNVSQPYLSQLQQQKQAAGLLSPPQTPLEKRLRDIWCEVLQQQEIGRDQNFFALGGHSLHALRIVARIEQQLAVRLSLAELLQCRTIKLLADLLNARMTGKGAVHNTIKRVVRGQK
ncbi:non-ribosomal peptide synthetase [Xenorhabdus innexi]|uniref:Putative Glutamate racemase n=1 Tax=Xenorhabdus innexi TaxID=290109 RepID=A0A1N6MYD4_9GAMM|nr:non-ribosomal peptide synthetase [Xenorhabdus innexi]PHM38767.1 pvdj [Xenorhabdus innexi]SIP73794.1 putative Glutamate racemase [Xenorhabdus innexi]